MNTLMDILQAAGIGVAVGIRPFLPAFVVGLFALGDIGIDFDGTDFAFLEQAPFLIAMVVAAVAFDVSLRRGGDARFEERIGLITVGLVALAIAALEGSGTLADRHDSIVPGLAAAVATCVLALIAVPPLFARVRTRLGAEAGLLPAYREGLGVLIAALSVLLPPFAIVAVGALLWLLAGGRRREGEKYAGLRILR